MYDFINVIKHFNIIYYLFIYYKIIEIKDVD